MQISEKINNKKIFFILQRDWGIKHGYEIIKKLNKNGNKFSVLNFKDSVESFAKHQNEIKFEHILNDSEIFEDKENILRKNKYTAENFVEDFRINSIWKYAFTLRRFATSYEKKFPYSFQQHLNDQEFQNYILAFANRLKKVFYEFKPDLVIGYIFGDIRQVLLNQLCDINKIPMLCSADSKVENINIFIYDFNYSKSFFHDRLIKLNNKKVKSKNYEKAQKFLNEQRNNFNPNVMIRDEGHQIDLEKNSINFEDFKTFISRLKRYFYLKINKKKINHKFLHVADNPSFKFLIRDYISGIYNLYKLKKINYDNLENLNNFVYLPLGHYPETQLGISNTVYDNQINTIKIIARYLPKNLTLAVKDHPYSFGLNSFSFLEKIKNTPNVKLLKYDEQNIEIFKKMHSLISFCGSTIFEASILKKPAIQIGTAKLMSNLPNFYSVNDLTKIDEIINNIDRSFENYSKTDEYDFKLLNYISAAFDTGCKFDAYESDLRYNKDNLDHIWTAYELEIKKILKFKNKFLFE